MYCVIWKNRVSRPQFPRRRYLILVASNPQPGSEPVMTSEDKYDTESSLISSATSRTRLFVIASWKMTYINIYDGIGKEVAFSNRVAVRIAITGPYLRIAAYG